MVISIKYNIKYKNCDCFLEYINFEHNFIEHKYLCCNKNYQHKFDEKLKEQCLKTNKFSNYDIRSLFHCSETVLILMNIWITGKN